MARRFLTLSTLLTFFCILPAYSQPLSPRSLNGAELRLAVKKLTVLGSVLYVAAHPDDDNTAFLGFMAKGRLIRTAYLSMTRGEGGQNLIGSEQGELLGVIRTQELLASRRIDGAEQFFTRAIDFGFSKTLDETMKIWGKERILSDVVWIIRSYRPDVIVTRFTPTQGGHGNHTSSAELADEAFAAAGDPSRFPEQLRYVKPWQAKRIVWNVFRFQQSDRPAVPEHSVSLDLGSYSPILGESFTEMAGRSRSMNRSQGTGGGQNRGEFINYFQHVAGDTARTDLFDGVNTTWARVPGRKNRVPMLQDISQKFDEENPSKSIPALLRVYGELGRMQGDPWIEIKKHDLQEVIRLCGGLWIDALASDNSAIPGTEIKVTLSAINRSSCPFQLERAVAPFDQADTILHLPMLNNQQVQVTLPVKFPRDLPYTQPYWLEEPSELGAYRIPDQRLVGLPENPPALSVKVQISSGESKMDFEVPVRCRVVDPVEGEQYRPFVVNPPVTVSLPENVYIFPDGVAKTVIVIVRNDGAKSSGTCGSESPCGMESDSI